MHSALQNSIGDDLNFVCVTHQASYGQSLSGSIPWSPAFFAIKASAARLNAGLGSLGVERYFVLIEADSTANEDDRILECVST
jgi:uncharacterized protein (DUF2252 family)